jgi:hypothetical protein
LLLNVLKHYFRSAAHNSLNKVVDKICSSSQKGFQLQTLHTGMVTVINVIEYCTDTEMDTDKKTDTKDSDMYKDMGTDMGRDMELEYFC